MPRKIRAVISGTWWTTKIESIKCCFVCGGRLKRGYVEVDRRHRLTCVDCRHITYINPKLVAGVIPVLPDGRIILLKRNMQPALGFWTYPAGYQEWGESVAEAAQRETREEIKTNVTITRLIGVYSYSDAGVVTIVYEGRVGKKEKPAPGEEAQELMMVKPNQIPWKELAFRSTRDALKDWKKSL